MSSCEIGPVQIWKQISGRVFCPGVSSRNLIWATFAFYVISTPQLQTHFSFLLDRKSSRDHFNGYRQTSNGCYCADSNQRLWIQNYHHLIWSRVKSKNLLNHLTLNPQKRWHVCMFGITDQSFLIQIKAYLSNKRAITYIEFLQIDWNYHKTTIYTIVHDFRSFL